jgi:hypothetical protein
LKFNNGSISPCTAPTHVTARSESNAFRDDRVVDLLLCRRPDRTFTDAGEPASYPGGYTGMGRGPRGPRLTPSSHLMPGSPGWRLPPLGGRKGGERPETVPPGCDVIALANLCHNRVGTTLLTPGLLVWPRLRLPGRVACPSLPARPVESSTWAGTLSAEPVP